MPDLHTVWSGDIHGPTRGLLCALDAMHETREATSTERSRAMIGRQRPKRIRKPVPRDPTMITPRRGYHQAYYRRRKQEHG